MGIAKVLEGPRLPYVVVRLDGTVPVEKTTFDRRTGKLVTETKDVPAGYLAFFPAGHYLHIRTKEELIRYKLDKKPKPIAADGMALHPSQSVDKSYENLEADVVSFVRAKVGQINIPGYKGKLNLPKHQEVESYV